MFIQSPFDFLTHIQVLINIQRNFAAASNRIYVHARTTFLHKITRITYSRSDRFPPGKFGSIFCIYCSQKNRKKRRRRWMGGSSSSERLSVHRQKSRTEGGRISLWPKRDLKWDRSTVQYRVIMYGECPGINDTPEWVTRAAVRVLHNAGI